MDFLSGKRRLVRLKHMNRVRSTESAFWKLVAAVPGQAVWTTLWIARGRKAIDTGYWCDVLYLSSDSSVREVLLCEETMKNLVQSRAGIS